MGIPSLLGIIGFTLAFYVFGREADSTLSSAQQKLSPSISRQRRWADFSFYTIGRFANDVCQGTNQLTGTCVVRGECKEDGGIAAGNCSSTTKQAVCCVYQKTCGSSTSLNNTYFYNSGYPSTYLGGGQCSIEVKPNDESICQLRIDFMALSLAPPNADGECLTDLLTITGGSSVVPKICGENSKQHVYVNFNGQSPIAISVATSASYAFNRQWQLQIAQIPCASPTQAPSGCLQYFFDSSGTVSSFNYGSSPSPFTNTMTMVGTRQLVNQNYGICVRMAANMCSITWKPVRSDTYAFTMTNDVGAVADQSLIGMSLVQEQDCTTDYILIPNPVNDGVSLSSDRFCGLGLGEITSFTKPFNIYVKTDNNENSDGGNRGFYLSYSQNSCPII